MVLVKSRRFQFSSFKVQKSKTAPNPDRRRQVPHAKLLRRGSEQRMDEDAMEDPWGGGAATLSSPRSPQFNLPSSLNDATLSPGLTSPRFFGAAEDPLVRAVVDDAHLSNEEKTMQLQSLFSRAASNGDIQCVRTMLQGPANEYIDVDAEDEDGTTPLIHAACFGHADVVRARMPLFSCELNIVLDAGCEVDKQDQRKWSALMWATSNSQPQIVRLLIDHGASPTAKTGSGRTALDLLKHDDPNREIEGYLRRQSNGNEIGNVGVSEDWYDRGFGGDLEEQFAESERKKRMMMESAFNLEVDISSLGIDEPTEVTSELMLN
jgi:Ankyrin repeats (many copies)/Ankyrin repeats (3 copies)